MNVSVVADQEFYPVFQNPPKTDILYEVSLGIDNEQTSLTENLGIKTSKMEDGNDNNFDDSIAVFLVWQDQKIFASEEASLITDANHEINRKELD